MIGTFKRLERVLKLEAKQGYQNKAVVGGIRQFAAFWVSEAREEAFDEADKVLVEQVAEVLNGYARLPGVEARADAIDNLMAKLKTRRERVGPRRVAAPAGARRPPDKPHQAPKPKEEPAPPPPEEIDPDPEGLAQSVTAVKGVGPATAERLAKLGAQTIHDLLYTLPHRYEDYTLLKPIQRLEYGERVTVIGTLWEVRARRTRSNQTLVQAIVSDGTGTLQVTWFNQPWLTDKLESGSQIMLRGEIDRYLGKPVMNAPEWEQISQETLRTGRIIPIYPLTEGLSAYRMRNLMEKTVAYWAPRVPEPLPETIRERRNLLYLPRALKQAHFPDSQEKLHAGRRRLAFDELFLLQLGMLGQRREWQSQPGLPLPAETPLLDTFVDSLPYQLTGAQQRVIGEIAADMAREVPMNRLLQGDVGSGKTVVAAAAMLLAVAGGAQAALMAPTEILAEQHYRGVSEMLAGLNVDVRLLTGSTPAGEKAQIYAALADGTIDVIIGTHALIQEPVQFHKLGLAVIDEQHRFGVDQRGALRDKGPASANGHGGEPLNPHLLVMSATPIPRTLALSMYGDLDVSVIDEMPPGREEIRTRWIRPRERERAYAFVRGQVEKGRQAYIICPLVEESDKVEAKAAVEEYTRLQEEVFPDLNLGLLHGRLKSDEKEAAMRAFAQGDTDILVATSVIEVGVDVPNSTVMVVEGANRFGLAQLHQFRGRVGRGQHQSYCLLISDTVSAEAEERLTALEETNDGFQLAEKDLELRGPGEFFGRRQSGLPELQLASLLDVTLLEEAREEAQTLFAQDPTLEAAEHRLLRDRVLRFWEDAADVS